VRFSLMSFQQAHSPFLEIDWGVFRCLHECIILLNSISVRFFESGLGNAHRVLVVLASISGLSEGTLTACHVGYWEMLHALAIAAKVP